MIKINEIRETDQIDGIKSLNSKLPRVRERTIKIKQTDIIIQKQELNNGKVG